MKKALKEKVDTIEKLAQLVAGGFADIDENFHKVDQRFVALGSEVRNGFQETRAALDRIDTRLAALEMAVFGGTSSNGGRLVAASLLSRLDKLERAVFKK